MSILAEHYHAWAKYTSKNNGPRHTSIEVSSQLSLQFPELGLMRTPCPTDKVLELGHLS